MLVSFIGPIDMNKTVSDLWKILGRVAKDGKQMVKSQMEEQWIALSDPVCAFDKRCGLKIVGKPCEGKPHARFDEGLLGRLYGRTSGLLYEIIPQRKAGLAHIISRAGSVVFLLITFPAHLDKFPKLINNHRIIMLLFSNALFF